MLSCTGFSPLATFMSMYLYERPVLSACDMLEGTVPFADFIPTCTIGWLLDNRQALSPNHYPPRSVVYHLVSIQSSPAVHIMRSKAFMLCREPE